MRFNGLQNPTAYRRHSPTTDYPWLLETRMVILFPTGGVAAASCFVALLSLIAESQARCASMRNAVYGAVGFLTSGLVLVVSSVLLFWPD